MSEHDTSSTSPAQPESAAAGNACCQQGCSCATASSDKTVGGFLHRHASTILVAAIVAALVGLLTGYSASGVRSSILCPGPHYMTDAPMDGHGWHDMGTYQWRYHNLGLGHGYTVDGATATTLPKDRTSV